MTIRTPWFEIRILSRRSVIMDEYQRNGKLAAVGLARRWLQLTPSAALEYVNKLEMKQMPEPPKEGWQSDRRTQI